MHPKWALFLLLPSLFAQTKERAGDGRATAGFVIHPVFAARSDHR
jgi:hypothetical protein